MKSSSTVLTTVAVLLLTLSVAVGQHRTATKVVTPPVSPQSKRPVATQPAMTEDGRAVLLKSDGTWEYDPTPKPSPTPFVQQESTLVFDTGLVMRSGDVKPIARGAFHLLDTDLQSILTSAGFQPDSGSSLLSTFALKYVARQLEALRGATVTTYDRTMMSSYRP